MIYYTHYMQIIVHRLHDNITGSLAEHIEVARKENIVPLNPGTFFL